MKMTYHKAKGFTLVELLVVIAIIASLATLATPVILKALTKAKIVTAQNICVSLENAVDRFENDYSYLPFGGGGEAPSEDLELTDQENDDFMAVLAGIEDEVNYKQNEYFSLDEPKGTNESNYKDGMHIDKNAMKAQLFDAWGERYYFILDYDLDGEIDHPFESNTQIYSKKVLVFSSGPDGPANGRPTTGATNKVLKTIPSNFLK